MTLIECVHREVNYTLPFVPTPPVPEEFRDRSTAYYGCKVTNAHIANYLAVEGIHNVPEDDQSRRLYKHTASTKCCPSWCTSPGLALVLNFQQCPTAIVFFLRRDGRSELGSRKTSGLD